MAKFSSLPLYTTLLFKNPSPRGYSNTDAILENAVIPTNNGNVLARQYFHAAEHERRKLTPVERGILIKCLDKQFLRGFCYELPFILEHDIEGVHGSAVEIFMGDGRYIAYLEQLTMDKVLGTIIRIPMDSTDPEIHINNTKQVAPILAQFA